MKRFGLSGWVGFIGVAVIMAAEVLAARPAVIRGPERAFLRRGPGTEFQAYATVENGEQVTVDEVTGTWALVHLSGGQSGYVHAAFLFYADGQPVLVPVTPTAAPVAAATAVPTAQVAVVATVASTPSRAVPAAAAVPPAAAAAEVGELRQANAQLSAEVESLKREVETLRRNPSAGPSSGDDVVALRAEVRRLADITDALRTRLDSPSSGALPLVGGEEPWGTSTVVVLAGCALIVGWLVGGVLARREERGRRNRIRF